MALILSAVCLITSPIHAQRTQQREQLSDAEVSKRLDSYVDEDIGMKNQRMPVDMGGGLQITRMGRNGRSVIYWMKYAQRVREDQRMRFHDHMKKQFMDYWCDPNDETMGDIYGSYNLYFVVSDIQGETRIRVTQDECMKARGFP